MMDLACIEFYNTPEGDVMVKPVNGAVYVLKESNRDVIQSMLQLIDDRYPEAFKALSKLYSSNSMNRVNYEYLMVHRFCRCNFGEYDSSKLDVDYVGIFNLEQVKCPLRNSVDCRYCGVICSPVLNTNLSDRETQILELISKGMTNQQISDELSISIFTVIRHRNNMRAKLQVSNTAELVSYYKNMVK